MSREEAARYSFLLAIPAIGGAVATKVPDVADGNFHVTGPVIAGFFASMIVGWIAIEWLLRYVRTHSFVPFAIYLLIAAPICAVIIELRCPVRRRSGPALRQEPRRTPSPPASGAG